MNAPVSAQTLDEAIAWQLRFGDGNPSTEDCDAFERWMRAQPDNARAWRQLGEIDAQLASAAAPAERAAVLKAASATGGRGKKAATVLVLLATVGLGAALLERQVPLAGLLADQSTRTGERRSVTLPDESMVILNTRSAIDVEFDDERRAVQLHEGEILIETAHGNPGEKRPFVVLTPDGSLRALGTRFLARRMEQGTLLTVLQSAVAAKPGDTAGEQVIREGEEAILHAARVDGRHPARPEADAWSDGMLVVENMRLADVVAELARYRTGRLSVAPQVADLRVTGTFPLDNPDLALAALARGLPVKIQRVTGWWITLVPAAH